MVYDCFFFFFFKQKTAYEMRISDWSSDVCSSDLLVTLEEGEAYFSVAQDTKRPFVVAAGEHRLRTSHGSFRVLKLAEKPVDILVQQGRVVVAARSGLTPEPPLSLPANTRITFDRRSEERRVGKEVIMTCDSRWSPV